jgi:hypothetical protein
VEPVTATNTRGGLPTTPCLTYPPAHAAQPSGHINRYPAVIDRFSNVVAPPHRRSYIYIGNSLLSQRRIKRRGIFFSILAQSVPQNTTIPVPVGSYSVQALKIRLRRTSLGITVASIVTISNRWFFTRITSEIGGVLAHPLRMEF